MGGKLDEGAKSPRCSPVTQKWRFKVEIPGRGKAEKEESPSTGWEPYSFISVQLRVLGGKKKNSINQRKINRTLAGPSETEDWKVRTVTEEKKAGGGGGRLTATNGSMSSGLNRGS